MFLPTIIKIHHCYLILFFFCHIGRISQCPTNVNYLSYLLILFSKKTSQNRGIRTLTKWSQITCAAFTLYSDITKKLSFWDNFVFANSCLILCYRVVVPSFIKLELSLVKPIEFSTNFSHVRPNIFIVPSKFRLPPLILSAWNLGDCESTCLVVFVNLFITYQV